jgi:PAS domain S-box-containing protein
VVAIDHRGRVLEWSPAAERTFGFSAQEAVGAEMAALIVPPALRARHRDGLARYLAGGTPRVLDRRIEITAVRRDGEEFPVELTITRIDDPGDPVFVGYLRDITDRHRAEQDLRASRARIVTAADAARRRLERDLHDGAQQHLVGLALTLRLARRKVGSDDELAAELLDEAIEDLTAATGELRELARGLHPAVLTEGGLQPALTSLAKRSKLSVRIEQTPEGRLPAPVEITAYFVVAEALTNVSRYAEAGRVTVSACHANGTLVVEVRDDGRGGADASRGSGLRGLDDRVTALGGRLTVDSPEGQGTMLRAELPCAS